MFLSNIFEISIRFPNILKKRKEKKQNTIA